MPLFFILSGMVASLSRERNTALYAWKFIKRRFRQLALPFFIWGLIFTPLVFKQSHGIYDYSLMAISLLKHPDEGLWFLIVLFCIQIYYYIACLIGNLLKRFNMKFSGDIIGMFFVLSVLTIVTRYIGTSQYISLQYTLMFFVGCFILKFRILDNAFINAILLLIFAIIVPYYDFISSPTIFRIFTGIFASLPIIHICKVTAESSGRVSPFLNFGRHSLEIYATHYCIILGFKQGIRIESLSPIALCLLLFILSCVLCYLITQFSSILCKNKYLALFLYGK